MRGPKHTPNEIHIQGDVAYMVLTNRQKIPVAVTMFDAADVPQVLGVGMRWFAQWREGIQNYYVKTQMRGDDGVYHGIALHRFLVGPLPCLDTDHKNNNPLDNRRQNLLPVTRTENARNYRPGAYAPRESRPGEPTYTRRDRIEVWQLPGLARWRTRVTYAGVSRSAGRADSKEAARELAQRFLDTWKAEAA